MESHNNDDEVRLCKGCQQFYGRQSTNFLCSGCFKQAAKEQTPSQQKPEVQALTVAPELSQPAPVEAPSQISSPKQLPTQSQPEPAVALPEESKEEPKVEAPAVQVSAHFESFKLGPITQVNLTFCPQTNKNKCWNCNKKVGLVQTECRCGYVYCPKHRHAEAHNCQFDYLQAQQDRLAKENPIIQNKKLQAI